MRSYFSFGIACLMATSLTFTSCDQKQADDASTNVKAQRDSTAGNNDQLRIAFIYGDTINVKYNYLIDAEQELESEGKLIDDRIRRKYERAEKRAAELQREAPSMGQLEMQEAQIEMQNLQLEIQEFQEKLARDFRQREIELQQDYLSRINTFLKEYNKDETYDVILNFQPGGNLLWVSSAFDITDEVLEGLNKQYADELATASADDKK